MDNYNVYFKDKGPDLDSLVSDFNIKQKFAKNLSNELINKLGIDITKIEHAGLLRTIEVEQDEDDDVEYVNEIYSLWKDADVIPSVTAASMNEYEDMTVFKPIDSSRVNRQKSDDVRAIAEQVENKSLDDVKQVRSVVSDIIKLTDDKNNLYDWIDEIKEKSDINDIKTEFLSKLNLTEPSEDIEMVRILSEGFDDSKIDTIKQYISNNSIPMDDIDFDSAVNNKDISEIGKIVPHILEKVIDRTNEQLNAKNEELKEKSRNIDLRGDALLINNFESTEDYAKRTNDVLNRKEDEISTSFTNNINLGERYFSAESDPVIKKLMDDAVLGNVFVTKPGSLITDPEGSFQVSVKMDGTVDLVPLAEVIADPKNEKIKGYIDEIQQKISEYEEKNELIAYYWDARYNNREFDSSKDIESLESFNAKLPEEVKVKAPNDIWRFMIANDDGSLSSPLSKDDMKTVLGVQGKESSKIEQRLVIDAVNKNLKDGNDIFYTDKNNEIHRITKENGQFVTQNINEAVEPKLSILQSVFRFILQFIPGYKKLYADYDKSLANYNKLPSIRNYSENNPNMKKDAKPSEADSMEPYQVNERVNNLIKYGYIEKANSYTVTRSANPFAYVLADGRKVGELSEIFGRAEKQAENVVERFNLEPTKSYWDNLPQEKKEDISERITRIAADCEIIKDKLTKMAQKDPDGKVKPSLDDLEAIGRFTCLQRAMQNGELRNSLITAIPNDQSNLFKNVIYTETMLNYAKNGISSKEVMNLFSTDADNAKFTRFASKVFTQQSSPETTRIAEAMGDLKEKWKDSAVLDAVEKWQAKNKNNSNPTNKFEEFKKTIDRNNEMFGLKQ